MREERPRGLYEALVTRSLDVRLAAEEAPARTCSAVPPLIGGSDGYQP